MCNTIIINILTKQGMDIQERIDELTELILGGVEDWDYSTLEKLLNLVREQVRQEYLNKAIYAFYKSTVAFPHNTDIKAIEEQKKIFIEKLNS